MVTPPRLWVCFDHHATDHHVWSIREGNTWHRAQTITILAPLTTVYRGPNAAQPRAYLAGHGHVTISPDGHATITKG